MFNFPFQYNQVEHADWYHFEENSGLWTNSFEVLFQYPSFL